MFLWGSATTRSAGLGSLVVVLALAIAACGSGGGGSAATGSGGTQTSNSPPVISGTPVTSVVAGTSYAFTPTASDPDHNTLSFTIAAKPAWASFNNSTGQLSGAPASADVGTYSNIVVSVSDGQSSASLPAFSIIVSAPAPAATLALKYPGDVGIGGDPSVVQYENFEEGSVAAVVARYDNTANTPGMALVADHPVNGPGSFAMQFTSGGSNAATHIYKSFGAGYDELYFRYYMKYVGSGPWHHSGLWVGGYNPALLWPYPRAGQRPNGTDWYSIGLEPISSSTNAPMDFYTYWMGMHSWKDNPTGAVGDHYGNTLLHNAEFRMQSDTWVCYEVHLKLNPDPTTSAGAVLELWQNDQLIRRFDDSGPFGYWVKDKFCPNDADGTDCTAYRAANPMLVLLDQQWRATSPLKINYFWPQNYNDSSTSSSLQLDDMVVAAQRVGCTVKK
jgi:hypothetical protein